MSKIKWSLYSYYYFICSCTPVSLNGQTEGNYPLVNEAANESLVNEGQTTEFIAEICDNSVDDDGDALVDNDDEDCPAQARQPESRAPMEKE